MDPLRHHDTVDACSTHAGVCSLMLGPGSVVVAWLRLRLAWKVLRGVPVRRDRPDFCRAGPSFTTVRAPG